MEIGVIDSGVGGLTVWKEIVTLLPHVSTIYLGDSAYTPYGNKSSEDIYQLAKRMVEFLVEQKVRIIVIACNTITVHCLTQLRETFPQVTFIGTVPAIKPAAAKSRNKRIGILSTTATAQSEYQENLIAQFASPCNVTEVGCDEIVPLIEQGRMDGPDMEVLLKQVLAPFIEADIDTLVLACTHFPLLRDQIQYILGENVMILDSGSAIAAQVERVIEAQDGRTEATQVIYTFFTTGQLELLQETFQALRRGVRITESTVQFRSIPVKPQS